MSEVDHHEAMFDSTYLRWFHLEGSPALVEVVKVERRVELTLRGGAKAYKPVVHLNLIKGSIDAIKPLVMNKTNSEAIAAIHGVKPSEWPGKQIVLYQDTTKLKGETVNCIRIRAKKAPTKKEVRA